MRDGSEATKPRRPRPGGSMTELEAARQYVGRCATHAGLSRQWRGALVADALDRFEAAVRADEANRNANRNEAILDDSGAELHRLLCPVCVSAPGGTRTHDLTPKTNPDSRAVRRISPGATAGDTPAFPPKRAQSRNRNRNGAVTGRGAP
jgi:hypothetical protein